MNPNEDILTPSQISKELGVATITVYKWIEGGKLRAKSLEAGSQHRLVIDRPDFEAFKLQRQSEKIRPTGDFQRTKEADEWVEKYRNLFNALPPGYLPFNRGLTTFDEMKAEAKKQVEYALSFLF